MKQFFVCTIVAALCVASINAAFQCPKPNGQFEDEVQCDKYYECDDGVAKEKLCPDGLVFDPLNRKINKCDQPFNVDCGDRVELQEPKASKFCPRKNGFFAHPDETVCDIFYNCIDGDALETKCTVGLHFDEFSGTCVWPETAKRENCVEETKKSASGFQCPKDKPKTDARGQTITHPRYPHPTDCQKFYVCLNGEDPRDLGCQTGEVYNDETEMCDAPENVPGCEDWYKDSDEKKTR
ncbi:protein obstructor-E [Stomoxys calcitrans]|uniref:Chitin-binding type-2 domain-containing protein n=1 Tax=Stomoxys calcitrans TaxID=35570 RepID=A0A1I8PCV1_STOCA|nr:protein obstructor-E [Stomoxys calcitrans]